MPKKDSITPWANIAGKGLAHVQDGIDRLTDWGFKKMREAGDAKEEVIDPDENKIFKGAKTFGKGVLSFFGKAGDAYYRKYEELKKK